MNDLISREQALKAVHEAIVEGKSWYAALSHLPSAEKTGEWTNNQNGTFTCSICGCKHSRSKFCPNCGARMMNENE